LGATFGTVLLTVQGSVVTMCTIRLHTQKFYIQPTHYISVFCMDLRANSDYFPLQH